MHVSCVQFHEVYGKVKELAATANGAETVLIFVAPDLDAICSCKILLVTNFL
jgi:hypothetical protein